VLAWLSVWSEVQMICIWSCCCHCHPIISSFIKIQNGLTFLVPANPGWSGKEAVKRVSQVCVSVLSWDNGLSCRKVRRLGKRSVQGCGESSKKRWREKSISHCIYFISVVSCFISRLVSVIFVATPCGGALWHQCWEINRCSKIMAAFLPLCQVYYVVCFIVMGGPNNAFRFCLTTLFGVASDSVTSPKRELWG